MFEKTLTDMIRHLRANKKNEAKYISFALDEIRKELKSNDLDIKANAISKLTYLQMLGYEISWASFNVIEVMSSSKFQHKRIGYLAAAQSFSPETDVLMLATNLIKKDLSSGNMYDTSVALNGLANVVTTDLARDLSSDVVSLLTHSKPYIRKKATLVMYKIFLRFPEALRPAFPRLKDKLADEDPAVTSAAVNVICELARKNPKNYLPQAPQLFKLLTGSSNNWMLIKIIKLFGALMPSEPRLAKKLVDPITNLIQTTPAMSLLYECINTVTQGEMDHLPLVKLCVSKLRVFIEDPDQNLKYLGLLALGRFLAAHPKIVAEHNDIILKCIDDDDVSIRMRSLDLLVGMVTKKNLPDIVRKLLSQLDNEHPLSSDPQYRTEMVKRIVDLCSQNNYQHVTDFEWYINVLVTMCRTEGANQGKLLASQLLDVAVRVKIVRPYVVKQMFSLLQEERLYGQHDTLSANRDVLAAAAWILGEFAEHIENPQKTIQLLLKPLAITLPGFIQAAFVENTFKIVSKIASNPENENEMPNIITFIVNKLAAFTQSNHLEVQERACSVFQLMALVSNQTISYRDLAKLVEGELNPVAKKAQQKVPLPSDIDLDEWINEPIPDDEIAPASDGDFHLGGKNIDLSFLDEKSKDDSDDEDEEDNRNARLAQRQERVKHDPFYLGSGSGKAKKSNDDIVVTQDDIDSIPIARLDLSTDIIRVDKKGKKGKKSKTQDEDKHFEVTRDEEMPAGAKADSDDESPKKAKAKKSFTLSSDLDVDLTTPLSADEQLPTLKAYASPEEVRKKEEEAFRKRKENEAKNKKAKKEEKTKKEGKEDKKKKKKKAETGTSKKKDKKKKTETLVDSPALVNVDVDRTVYEDVADAQDDVIESEDMPLPPRYRVLGSDQNIRLSCEMQVDGNHPNSIVASVVLENLTEDAVISSLEFSIVDSLNLRVDPSTPNLRDGSVKVPFSILASQQNAFDITFAVKNITQSQTIKSVLAYSIQKGGSSTAGSIDFKFPFPVSVFIFPEQCENNRFALLLSEPNNFPAHVTSKLPLSPNRAFRNAVAVISALLHVDTVQEVEGGASLYGRTIQDHHVAALVKLATDGKQISVDIKASDSTLATSLKTQLDKEFY